MLPSIAVVTVTLNAETELPNLFASLRGQDDRQFDFIVIDGASSDQTWKIIQAASDIVTTAVSEPDLGLYHALNKAIQLIKSDYYIVMGSDDVFCPGAIRDFKALAASTVADVIVAGVRKRDKVRSGYHPDRAWLGHSAMVTSHSVGMLIRADLHRRFGEYSMRYPMLADGHFIKKICTDPTVKTVQGNFVAGVFSMRGLSNQNFVRSLCENWQIQIETGERPLVQYLLFQARLIKNLFKVLRSKPPNSL